MTKILSGKEVAAALKQKLTAEVNELKKQGKIPGLCIVMVGDRPDSASYIKGAVKRCTGIGRSCGSGQKELRERESAANGTSESHIGD